MALHRTRGRRDSRPPDSRPLRQAGKRPTILFISTFDSPLGRIWFAADRTHLLQVQMPVSGGGSRLLRERLLRWYGPVEWKDGGDVCAAFAAELERFFSGEPLAFKTPARPRGTEFQERVWKEVARIPYGETRTYAEIARRIANPRGARAVGQANRANPLPLLIPCHRVTAAGGTLGGYAPGVEQKRFLLRLEGSLPPAEEDQRAAVPPPGSRSTPPAPEGTRDVAIRYARVDPRRIVLLKSLLEGYEGHVVVRTKDPKKGVVQLLVSPDFLEEIDQVLRDLARWIWMESAEGPPTVHFRERGT